METLTFKLEEFEGPLDLLLYLVSKNKMNLYEVAILCLLYTSPSPRDRQKSRMPSSA